MKMISMITIALLPLLSLAQGTTNRTGSTNSTNVPPECQKAIQSVSSSCKTQTEDWMSLAMNSCKKFDECTPDQRKNICQKFNNEVLKCVEPVIKSCPSSPGSDFDVVKKGCAEYSNASSKNYSGLTMQVMFSILAFLFFLN